MDATAATMLAGPEAGEILTAALATTGTTVTSWRLDALHPRPGAETSAGYEVDTTEGSLYLVASTVDLDARTRMACGAVRLDSDAGTVHVWVHPADPMLTDLGVACRRDLLTARLSESGPTPVTVSRLELLVLRPLRRAVLRADVVGPSGEETLYIKVVRPARAPGLLRRHALCALAPDARSAGGGLVAVAAAVGVPLTTALYRPHGGAAGWLDPARVDEALDTLPLEAMDLTRRPSVPDRHGHYGAVVSARLGDDRAIVALVDRVARGLEATSQDDECPTHGDLNPANVFVDAAAAPTRVSALIDIDTLGPGRRVDDHASLLAHLLVLPTLDRHAYADAGEYAGELFRSFLMRDDERSLRVRTAANLLALAATAAARDLRSWSRLAEGVLDRALLR